MPGSNDLLLGREQLVPLHVQGLLEFTEFLIALPNRALQRVAGLVEMLSLHLVLEEIRPPV